MIRVELPFHLSNLARVDGPIDLELAGTPTIGTLLDAIEARYPVLRGTIREHGTLKRRALVRFYACEVDYSAEPQTTPLPGPVVAGLEPFIILGAIAGG